MNRSFAFKVSAECQQFCLKDELSEEAQLGWTQQECERLLAIGKGIIGVGTTSDGLVSILLRIGDRKPPDHIGRWDQINECSLRLQSGKLVVAGIFDDEVRFGRLIDLEPGSYRVRLCYGNLGSRTDCGLPMDHYRVVLWPAKWAPLRVFKQAPAKLTTGE